MSTVLRTSFDFDDDSVILSDLTKEMEHDIPERLAILLCDSQIDCGTLVPAVQQALGCALVGGTSLTFPVSDTTGGNISASLAIVSKNGMKYAVALSEPLAAGEHERQVRAACDEVARDLGEEPKMLMAFFPHMPGFPTGTFIEELLLAAGDTPVFGGATTGDLISTRAEVFHGGRTYRDRMVLIALGGAIKPVFSTRNIVSRISDYTPTVTKSEGNKVLRVDGMTFCKYMESVGIPPEDRVNGVDALLQYGPVPVQLDLSRVEQVPEDGVPEVSCISYTSPEEGSATFSRHVPEGTQVILSLLTREDIEESAKQCLEGILQETGASGRQSDGYQYDTLFCVSCVARYFMMVGSTNSERALLTGEIPPYLTANGYYGFAEIGPTRDGRTQRIVNRAHSASIVMCAL